MKAKQWALRFENEEHTKVLADFAEECNSLISVRTQRSGVAQINGKTVNTTTDARTGALREQRQKWTAIQRLCPDVANVSFDNIINVYKLGAVATSTEQKSEDAEDGYGRKIADTLK